MDEVEIKKVYYKISVNLGPFSYCCNSRVYEISPERSAILPGLKYSLLTIFFGWWGFGGLRTVKFFKSIRNSLEALYVNFTGGEDITKYVDDLDFDDRTNFIWNNLLRKTTERIQKKEVEIILEIQDEFINQGKKEYSDENVNFIIICLGKIDIHRIKREEIEDVFDALRCFNQNDEY